MVSVDRSPRRTRRPRGEGNESRRQKAAKSKEIPIGLHITDNRGTQQSTEHRAQSTDHPPLDSTTDLVPGKGNALQYANARCQTTYHFNKHFSFRPALPLPSPKTPMSPVVGSSWLMRAISSSDVPPFFKSQPDRPSRQGLASSGIMGNKEVGRLALLYRYFS